MMQEVGRFESLSRVHKARALDISKHPYKGRAAELLELTYPAGRIC